MKRDNVIDAYRCLLMFGICLLHAITQGGHNTAWAANMLQWCVPGFMFVSGWFGIRFSLGKVLRLYGISFYCAVVFVVFDAVASSSWGGVGWEGVLRVYKIAISQWFLNAYVIVMCLAPILNLAIDRMTVKDLYPLMLLVFGWSFATTLPISGFVPQSSGLTAYSFLTLVGVYVFAGLARKVKDQGGNIFSFMINKGIKLLILVVCLIMAAIGFGDYNSPFALAIAGSMFFIFRNFTLSSWCANIFFWLNPSIFSVYLMHSHGNAWGYFKAFESYLFNIGFISPFVYLLTALCVFFACIVLDLPRRIIVCGLKNINLSQRKSILKISQMLRCVILRRC